MKKKSKKNNGRYETLNYWQRIGLPELKVSPTARHVWHVLWGRADTKGVVCMSFDQIANETGWSRRNCINCVNELIKKEIIKRHIRGGSNHTANTYAIKIMQDETGSSEPDALG